MEPPPSIWARLILIRGIPSARSNQASVESRQVEYVDTNHSTRGKDKDALTRNISDDLPLQAIVVSRAVYYIGLIERSFMTNLIIKRILIY